MGTSEILYTRRSTVTRDNFAYTPARAYVLHTGVHRAGKINEFKIRYVSETFLYICIYYHVALVVARL